MDVCKIIFCFLFGIKVVRCFIVAVIRMLFSMKGWESRVHLVYSDHILYMTVENNRIAMKYKVFPAI